MLGNQTAPVSRFDATREVLVSDELRIVRVLGFRPAEILCQTHPISNAKVAVEAAQPLVQALQRAFIQLFPRSTINGEHGEHTAINVPDDVLIGAGEMGVLRQIERSGPLLRAQQEVAILYPA